MARMSEGHANILLVDDKPDKLLALEAVLADIGGNLVRAASGREALRHLLHDDCWTSTCPAWTGSRRRR
jgi:hypothetical protein